MRAALLLVGSTLALAAAPSRAQPVLSVRLGWGPALGSAAQHVEIAELVGSQVPLQLDALWRFGRLSAGAYASYGLGLAARCDGSCSGSVARLGLQATLTGRLRREVELWGGLGAGYEWASLRRSHAGAEVTTTYRGFEVLSLQAGGDLRIRRRLGVGPWVQLGFGRYGDVRVSTSYETSDAPVPHPATHAWILAGVRGLFEL
jgi:hypothetical protein